MAIRAYPTSNTQITILNALGLHAKNFSEAEQIFSNLGLVVTSKRQGRSTVPVVQVLDRKDGGFNVHGEGVEFDKYPNVDFSALEQWIE